MNSKKYNICKILVWERNLTSNKSEIEFYGLLYLDQGELLAPNIPTNDFREQTRVYLNCAVNLAASLEARGINFVLLTNHKDFLNEILNSQKKLLQIREIAFTTDVPTRIVFHFAHFKLDVYRFFSTLKNKYVGYFDLDMVCINDIPRSFLNNIRQKIPMTYDISDQIIPSYGEKVVMRDLEAVHGKPSEGRWYGGEFLTGPPAFFGVLTREIEKIYGNYVRNMQKIHHVGMETFTSAALEILKKKGMYIADAGTLGIVGRYWNAKTLHPQKPFAYFKNCFLLHLPADKVFLSKLDMEKTGNFSDFEKYYNEYRNPIPRNKLQKLFLTLRNLSK